MDNKKNTSNAWNFHWVMYYQIHVTLFVFVAVNTFFDTIFFCKTLTVKLYSNPIFMRILNFIGKQVDWLCTKIYSLSVNDFLLNNFINRFLHWMVTACCCRRTFSVSLWRCHNGYEPNSPWSLQWGIQISGNAYQKAWFLDK